jgi:DNA-binding winged helix-turn-helix (wHTH) protein
VTKKVLSCYRFGSLGVFRLDVTTAKLYKNGKDIHLTRRCFEILMLLLESHGRVVSKEAMLARVWADSDVGESNISYHIHALRRILGDSPKNSTMIVTIPGVGYKFIDQVEVVEDGPIGVARHEEGTGLDPNPQPQARKVRKYRYWSIAAVIMMGIAIILLLIFSSGARRF